jgi:hypothetical protein
VHGANGAKVATVQGRNGPDLETLGSGDHGGVDGAERKIAVAQDELGDAEPVGGSDRLHGDRAGGEVAEKAYLRLGAEPAAEQTGDLGDGQNRSDQRARVRLQEVPALVVKVVVGVDVGVERPRVDEDCYERASSARICSIRTEMSFRPLAPAAAARSFRGDFEPR